MLQWGHALSGMDISPRQVDRGRYVLLQWGHALSGMDMRGAGIGTMTVNMLQWGHALSGMDMGDGTPDRPALNTLQWGHALAGMDIRVLPGYIAGGVGASMGPCPFRHGYTAICRDARRLGVASMGPCPFRHGYVKRMDAADGPDVLLQWGHALSGMDTCHIAIRLLLLFRASMGPCPFRHGYEGAHRAEAISYYRFNGAMPFQAWI